MGGWGWILIGAGILAYEVYTALQNRGQTLSEWTWRMSIRHPLVPFLVGVVAGHLFWQHWFVNPCV